MDYIKVLLRTVCSFIVVFQTTFICYSQPTQNGIDSLLSVGMNMNSHGQEILPLEKALQVNQHAYALSEQMQYTRGLMIARLNVVPYYLRVSRPDTALILLNEATREHFSKRDYLFLAAAQFRMASFYIGLNNYKRADMYYTDATNSIRKSDSQALLPSILQGHGALFLMRGNYAHALEIFKHVLEKRREVEAPGYSLHHEYFNIAMAYMRMKDYVTALKFARQATREKGASGGSAMIANIYLQMGKTDSALSTYKGVYKRALSVRDYAHASSVLNSIGGYYTRIGKYDSANMIFRTALTFNLQHKSYVYFRMAENYEKLNQRDSALFAAKLALANAQSMQYTGEIAAASLLISRFFEKGNQPDSALKFLKMHKVYNDSVFTKDLAQKSVDLRVQIETIEKEEEIALLKKKSEIDREARKFLWTLVIGLIITISFIIGFFRVRNRANRNKLEMEKQVLVTELREKEKALSNHTLQMIHHRNGFMEIEEELKRILAADESRRFHKIVNIINVNQSLDREWDNFNQYFSNVHQGFYENLKQVSSTLSLHEQRLCALIKMNLASREIATLLNIEVGSVKMAKYRLKKKLNLDEQEDLNEFIGRF